MTTNQQAMNEQLTALRRQGLGLDGDNSYKQDIIDCVIGALLSGAQGATPPPSGHWLEQFYEIGKEYRDRPLSSGADAVLQVAPDTPDARQLALGVAMKAMADLLNGSQYPFAPIKEIVDSAKAAGLVIVYGASDDLVEFDGAFRDQVNRYDGGTVLVDSQGVLDRDQVDDDDDEAIAAYTLRSKGARRIEALWGQNGYDWSYQTDIPHATFEILQGTERYCRGIVLAVDDLVAV